MGCRTYLLPWELKLSRCCNLDQKRSGLRYSLSNCGYIYAPNKDEDIIKFFKNVLTKLQTENLDSEENIVIGGDFNCPLNPILDKKGGIMTPRKSVINFSNDVQSQLDLVDIWRVKNPQTKSFTWSQQSPSIFCRLGFWLISNN